MFSSSKVLKLQGFEAPQIPISKTSKLQIPDWGSSGRFLKEINTDPPNPSAATNPLNVSTLQGFHTPGCQAPANSNSTNFKLQIPAHQIFKLQNSQYKVQDFLMDLLKEVLDMISPRIPITISSTNDYIGMGGRRPHTG